MGFIGLTVGAIIGILIFSSVGDTIQCPTEPQEAVDACNRAKNVAWTVLAILPIALFFAMFAIFSGSSRTDESSTITSHSSVYNTYGGGGVVGSINRTKYSHNLPTIKPKQVVVKKFDAPDMSYLESFNIWEDRDST